MWSANKKILMNKNEQKNLKLLGKNEEDLKVISAYLQDSVVKVKDIVFLEKNKTFLMMINRFMWEDAEKGIFRQNRRIRCAIKFEEVLKVKSKNINQKNINKPLECLAIKCTSFFSENYEINFFFSGNAVITLITEVIEVIMHDLGTAWKVKHIPTHKI